LCTSARVRVEPTPRGAPQVEHHLFPAISFLHYPAIARVVASECAARGIPYARYASLPDAIAAFCRCAAARTAASAPRASAAASLVVKRTAPGACLRALSASWRLICAHCRMSACVPALRCQGQGAAPGAWGGVASRGWEPQPRRDGALLCGALRPASWDAAVVMRAAQRLSSKLDPNNTPTLPCQVMWAAPAGAQVHGGGGRCGADAAVRGRPV